MRIQIFIRVWGAFVFLSDGFKDSASRLSSEPRTQKKQKKKKKQNLASTGDEDTLPVRHSQTAESSETGAVVTGPTGG